MYAVAVGGTQESSPDFGAQRVAGAVVGGLFGEVVVVVGFGFVGFTTPKPAGSRRKPGPEAEFLSRMS